MAKCEICKKVEGRRTVNGKPNCTRPKCYTEAVRAFMSSRSSTKETTK